MLKLYYAVIVFWFLSHGVAPLVIRLPYNGENPVLLSLESIGGKMKCQIVVQSSMGLELNA